MGPIGPMVLLSSPSFYQLLGYELVLIPLLSMLFQEVGEEEQFQHCEDDDDFHDDDSPKRLPQRHVPEAVVVQIEYTIQETVFAHKHLF